MSHFVICLPLLGILLLSTACFSEYCWGDRRAAGVGVPAAFLGVLEYFSCTNICCLSYQLVTPCDVAWTVSTAEKMWCWWRLCHDHACLGSILNMLLHKWWASIQVSWFDSKIWMAEQRCHIRYEGLLKQGQSSFKAALKKRSFSALPLPPSLLCTDAAPLKM